MDKEILCTLGPTSMNERVIYRLEQLGVSLFRINLSHVKIQELKNMIDYVQNRTHVPLCLDTEGAQIRTGPLSGGPITVGNSAILRAHRAPISADVAGFTLYPSNIIDSLVIGDVISIDFHAVLAQVIDLESNCAVLRVLNGGSFSANKAVTVDRSIEMPPLTAKDREALQLGLAHGIKTVALSFANRGADVDEIRVAAGPNVTVIAKIECRNGLVNLDAIAEKADALLIDRGDLSREVPIEQIPSLQKMITAKAKSHGRKVYVATNLLESMVTAPTPTRAEVNDVFNTLLDGVDGLVLAAETAIGDNPIGCANMIVKLIHEFERDDALSLDSPPRLGMGSTSLLVDPHGGELVDCQRPVLEPAELASLPQITANTKILMDCEQIALGTFSPVRGFMDRDNLESVLENHQLPGNTIWTMPILLPIQAEDAARLSSSELVVLIDTNGVPRAMLKDAHAYQMNLGDLAQSWYGTEARDHPGVNELLNGSGWFLAGDVTSFSRVPFPDHCYELTPAQARHVFTYKGWSRIVGFHTRNVIHRVHEHIILSALETSKADGILLSPVVGPKKPGDFLPGPIVKSYQTMLESGLLPSDRVVLGSIHTYPRYAGPREAVFTALCRKNMGCSHFILGRDHTGVGTFYKTERTRELFDQLGDLGIEPVFFEDIGYNARARLYETIGSNRNDIKTISGTKARDALRENRPLPDWYMRQNIQNLLREELASGRAVFSE